MKKALFLALTCIVLLAACDNTLNVTAPWKDIPAVHAIISPNDSAHYIRIEKAFLDPNTSALEIAKIPDSIYYQELEASIIDESTGEVYPLQEVDATSEGYPREAGIFATDPNILYKISASELTLKPGESYVLEIVRSEQLPVVTAETEIVRRPTINRPPPGQVIRFVYDQPFRVLWQESSNAYFYDVKLTINFQETSVENPNVFEPKSLPWKLGQYISINLIDVQGINFYNYLSAELEADPAIKRIFESIDVEVNAGGRELYEYRTILNANTGITGIGGDIPTYTNLSEGVGIFTSAHAHIVPGYDLHPESLDSLRNGSITEDLNFQ